MEQVLRTFDILDERLSGGHTIAALERVEYDTVVNRIGCKFPRLQKGLDALRQHPHVGPKPQPQGFNQLKDNFGSRRAVQCKMKVLVPGQHRVDVALSAYAGMVAYIAFQVSNGLAIDVRGAEFHRNAFDRNAREAKVVEPVLPDAWYARRSIGRDIEGVFSGEPSESLSHGHVTRAECLSQICDRQRLTGVELPSHQGMTEALVDAVLNRHPGGYWLQPEIHHCQCLSSAVPMSGITVRLTPHWKSRAPRFNGSVNRRSA
jgi:hypothetical protein